MLNTTTEKTLGLKDYKAIVKRRFKVFIAISAALVTVGVGIAFGLPAVYTSTGTILVEEQEVPDYLVRSTITAYADERLSALTQRVITRDNLADIISRHDLYPELGDASLQGLISQMRSNIRVETITSDILHPASSVVSLTERVNCSSWTIL